MVVGVGVMMLLLLLLVMNVSEGAVAAAAGDVCASSHIGLIIIIVANMAYGFCCSGAHGNHCGCGWYDDGMLMLLLLWLFDM